MLEAISLQFATLVLWFTVVPCLVMFPGTGDSLVFMEAVAKRSDPLIRIEASSVFEIGRVAVF